MKSQEIKKIVIFIVILFVLMVNISKILKEPISNEWYTNGLTDAYENPNYYDVIFCGTSMAITNISNEALYSEYGIKGLSLGKPSQATYLSYYTLEEALKYQNPQIVCFDVRSLFYSESDILEKLKDEYTYLHYSLDEMKNNMTKYQAVKQAEEISCNINLLDYLLPLYYNHANWENISEYNFAKANSNQTINGDLMFSVISVIDKGEITGNDGTVIPIPEINKKYLLKMIDLCKSRGIQLILLHSNIIMPWSWGEHNAVQKIAEEYDVPYIDINLLEKEIGFERKFDSADGLHHNVIGAKKWTKYLGQFFIDNSYYESSTKNKQYDLFENQVEYYEHFVDGVADKINLLRGTNFDIYLEKISQINLEENTVFFAISDEATMHLAEKEIKLLNALGLEKDLRNKCHYSYVGVLEKDGVRELLCMEAVSLEGELDSSTYYYVASGGMLSGQKVSISINGEEKSQETRGINIVVYNKTLKEVISSVAFDTFAFENPPTIRMTDSKIAELEIEENVWEVLDENK